MGGRSRGRQLAAEGVGKVDEIDTMWGPRAKGSDNEALRGLLNSGYRRGAVADRAVGESTNLEVHRFATFCPVVLAGIGSIPDIVADRSVPIVMRRMTAEQEVEPWRVRPRKVRRPPRSVGISHRVSLYQQVVSH